MFESVWAAASGLYGFTINYDRGAIEILPVWRPNLTLRRGLHVDPVAQPAIAAYPIRRAS